MSHLHFLNPRICDPYPYITFQNRYYSSILLNFVFFILDYKILYHFSSFQIEAHVLNLFFWRWDTCLTLLEKFEFLLKLVLRGEAHASPLWNKILCFEFVFFGWDTCLTLLGKSEFLIKFVLQGEVHASPSWNKILSFLKWGTCLIFMKQNSMFWICFFKMRHMPHSPWKIWISH